MEAKHQALDSVGKSSFSRYTDWRPNLLHGMSTAVFVGSRTVDSLLPPAGKPFETCLGYSGKARTWKTLRTRV